MTTERPTQVRRAAEIWSPERGAAEPRPSLQWPSLQWPSTREPSPREPSPPEPPLPGAPLWGPGMSSQDLAELTRAQFGVLTSAQAQAAGLSERRISHRVNSGQWVRVHHGIYQTQPGRQDWEARALAALFAAGSAAALTHGSAAYLHGLAPQPAVLEIGIPAQRRVATRPGMVVRRYAAIDARTDERAWPWRTTVEHTVLDLAARSSLDRAVSLAASASQRRLTSARALRATLVARGPHRWHLELAEALAVIIDGAESTMEVRFVGDVVGRHGLPAATVQAAPDPRRPWRSDVAFEEYRVLMELDGKLGHEGWNRTIDARRDRSTAGRGWLTARAGWTDVAFTPCLLAIEVGDVLRVRGWSGTVRPCRRPGCAVRDRR